jgi:hypothetical protein
MRGSSLWSVLLAIASTHLARQHAFDLAGRYKHQEAFIRARYSKVVPHLLAIELYSCCAWLDVTLPIDDDINVLRGKESLLSCREWAFPQFNYAQDGFPFLGVDESSNP